MFDRRINIFTGHFGSGKTEVAVNFAIKLSELSRKKFEHSAGIDEKTAIVDMDIINPFFRTVDAKSELEKHGIWVISSIYANTNVDIPALPSEIYTLFEKKEYKVVFDVGGDDLGAKAVSRFRQEILSDDYELFFVVNVKRPMTDTPEKIKEMIYIIEESSGIKITKLVNNTNYLFDTTAEDIIEGHKMLEEVSKETGVPIAFASGLRKPLEEAGQVIKVPLLPIGKLIKLPWEQDGDEGLEIEI
ncbi:MAG TPA: hypothetical protein GXX36_04440 [Clostridiaceae bacterium]|nr:hypothetical protein [Clostridiaceae bacterium]